MLNRIISVRIAIMETIYYLRYDELAKPMAYSESFVESNSIIILFTLIFILMLLFWLFGFYGITTFVVYVIPNPFLYK